MSINIVDQNIPDPSETYFSCFSYFESWSYLQNWKKYLVVKNHHKKGLFFGGGLYHQIFFSISEIRPWFKIWKTLKVSFWSICNILVNTWSTLKYFTTNKNWRYRKMTKKCIFCQIKEFPTHLQSKSGRILKCPWNLKKKNSAIFYE